MSRIVKKLEEEKTRNMRTTMEAVEKLDRFLLHVNEIYPLGSNLKSVECEAFPSFSLYERLQLDMGEKYQFLSENPGHGPSTIAILHKVIL